MKPAHLIQIDINKIKIYQYLQHLADQRFCNYNFQKFISSSIQMNNANEKQHLKLLALINNFEIHEKILVLFLIFM